MKSLAQISFFFSSRRRHTICLSDWSSDVCSSDLTTWWDRCARAPISWRKTGGSPRARATSWRACRRGLKNGKGACRGRGEISGGGGSLKKKKNKEGWGRGRAEKKKKSVNAQQVC